MNRIKRISMQLLEKYADLFSTDYEKNKEVIGRVAVFRSKGLRNEVTGYITNYVRAEIDSQSQVEEAGEEEEAPTEGAAATAAPAATTAQESE
ncbi:MAG: hypothetical protein ACE5JV_02340 [Nitrososphaerales archaeon]